MSTIDGYSSSTGTEAEGEVESEGRWERKRVHPREDLKRSNVRTSVT